MSDNWIITPAGNAVRKDLIGDIYSGLAIEQDNPYEIPRAVPRRGREQHENQEPEFAIYLVLIKGRHIVWDTYDNDVIAKSQIPSVIAALK